MVDEASAADAPVANEEETQEGLEQSGSGGEWKEKYEAVIGDHETLKDQFLKYQQDVGTWYQQVQAEFQKELQNRPQPNVSEEEEDEDAVVSKQMNTLMARLEKLEKGHVEHTQASAEEKIRAEVDRAMSAVSQKEGGVLVGRDEVEALMWKERLSALAASEKVRKARVQVLSKSGYVKPEPKSTQRPIPPFGPPKAAWTPPEPPSTMEDLTGQMYEYMRAFDEASAGSGG